MAGLLLHVAAGAVSVLAVAAGLLIWRLSTGPISLAPVVPYVEQALSTQDLALRVKVRDVVLTWVGWERTVDIRALDVRAEDRDGRLLGFVPEMAIGVSVAALARGILAPTRLDLFGPQLRLILRPDGRVGLAVEDLAPENSAAGDTASVSEGIDAYLEDILSGSDPARPGAFLTAINVLGAQIVIEDQARDLVWRASESNLTLERRGDTIHGNGALTLDFGADPIEIGIEGTYRDREKRLVATLDIDAIRLAQLAKLAPELEELQKWDLTIGGALGLAVNVESGLETLTFDLSAGPGTLILPALSSKQPEYPVALVQARGSVRPLAEGASDTAPPRFRMDLEEFYVDFGGPNISMAGIVSGDLDEPDLIAEVTVTNVSFKEVARFWPPTVAPAGRDWMIRKIHDGLLHELTLTLDLRPDDWSKRWLRRAAVEGTFTASQAHITYTENMPTVENVAARGWFDTIDLHVDVEGGQTAGLEITGGTVDLLSLDREGEIGRFDVRLAGSISDALKVLAQSPLDYRPEGAAHPDDVGGLFQGAVTLSMPLVEDLAVSDIEIAVTADLRDVSISGASAERLIAGRELTEGRARLTVADSMLDLSGEARLKGVPATVTWRENLDSQISTFIRKIDVAATVDSADRDLLGIDVPGVNGSVAVDVALVEDQDGHLEAAVTVDLREASMDLSVIGWRKAPGVPGTASFTLREAPDNRLEIADLVVSTADLSAAGSALIAVDDSILEVLRVDRLEVGDTHVSAMIERRPEGHYSVLVGGKSLDMRGTDDAEDETPGSQPPASIEQRPPIDIEGQVDRLYLPRGIVLLGARGRVRYAEERVESAALDGQLGDGDPISIRLEPTEGGRQLWVEAGDAGAVVRSLDLSTNLVGGTLSLYALIDDAKGETAGTLRMNDFRLINAPMLAKLLAIASLTGALEMLDGQGLAFSALEAPFVKRGDRLIVEKAHAGGLSIGMTLNGEIDLADEILDIEGTIVPAYLINTLPGRIPLLGEILTGGEGEGVFAATYTIEGLVSEPSVSVNPLAVLAPGILRRIFTIFDSPDEDEDPATRTPRSQ